MKQTESEKLFVLVERAENQLSVSVTLNLRISLEDICLMQIICF